jgi:deoxyribonuclease (pyrimidine dimer)
MRCNTGVLPSMLLDQHLLAEQVELLMIPGMLKKNSWIIRNKIPANFTLGKGHMTFWYDKLLYLHKRHVEIKKEVARRGFKVTDAELDLKNYPPELVNDWRPSYQDSNIIRERIIEKITAKKNNFWRYERNYLDLENVTKYIEKIKKSPLHYV